MRRVAYVYLPRWPLQRLCRAQPAWRDKAVALVDAHAARGPQVLLCTRAAERLGVRVGMPQAEAATLSNALCFVDDQPEEDRHALQKLAVWAERYTPIVALDDAPTPQALALDVTGGADCFGGEDRLLQKIDREFKEQGFFPRVALAPTLGMAWGMARYGPTPAILQEDEVPTMLSQLPVAALRLAPAPLLTLSQLGIQRVEQLMALPRDGMPSRLGPQVLERLDQALGRLPEPLTPYRFIPNIQAGFRFPHAVDRLAHVYQVLAHLLERILHDLEERQEGARAIECWLHFETAASLRVVTRFFRATRSEKHLSSLLRTRLEQVRFPEAAVGMSLRVTASEPLHGMQERFTEPPTPAGLPTLIDCLSNRLGPHAITRAILVPDPQPEYACRFEAVVETAPTPVLAKKKLHEPDEERFVPLRGVRPLQVLPKPVEVPALSVVPDGPPIKFEWDGMAYRVEHAWGPERIDTGWWRDHDVNRDYYRVTTDHGNRFWLFRRREDGRWFVHGCFD